MTQITKRRELRQFTPFFFKRKTTELIIIIWVREHRRLRE